MNIEYIRKVKTKHNTIYKTAIFSLTNVSCSIFIKKKIT